jgi:hypothetical protein
MPWVLVYIKKLSVGCGLIPAQAHWQGQEAARRLLFIQYLASSHVKDVHEQMMVVKEAG